VTPILSDDVATDLQRCDSPASAFDRLVQLYDEATGEIESAFADFTRGEAKHGPDPVYPYLCIDVTFDDKLSTSSLAFGKVTSPGRYGTTITTPRLFHNYLIEQLTLLTQNYSTAIYVGKSRTPIPLTFAVERASSMNAKQRHMLVQYFALPRLDAAHDQIADGGDWPGPGPAPLSLFSAERVDYSLHRLRHYSGTDPRYFQNFVLFTNYQRYIDEFAVYCQNEVAAGAPARSSSRAIASPSQVRNPPARCSPNCRKCRPITCAAA